MARRPKHLHGKDHLGHELAMAAIAGYPTLERAQTYMASQGYECSIRALEVVQENKGEKIAEIRKELAPQREGRLADDLLSTAEEASEVTRTAIAHASKLLAEGRVIDPAKMARDLQQITTQAVDKRLALEGRPTQIVEKRSADELARALVGMKVAEFTDVSATEESRPAIEESVD